MRKRDKGYAVDQGHLMKRSMTGMRVIPLIISEEDFFKAMHDDAGHWCGKIRKGLMGQQFWWPTMETDIDWFVSSCLRCQLTGPVVRVDTVLMQPVGALFHTFLMDFASPFPELGG